MLNTKKDFTALLFKLIDPLKDKYSKKHAFLDVGSHRTWYDEQAARMEAFARPLWGLVPFWTGGQENSDFEKIYTDGIANGTNPQSGEYWGFCRDNDQRFVEMAAIAYGLLLCPQKLWEPLSPAQRENLSLWLYSINVHRVGDNNWRFFRVLVNSALKKLGQKYDSEKTEEDFAKIESCYLGEGWYKDGPEGQRDYYISFAYHFYGLIYAHTMADEDAKRCKIFKERAEVFAKTFIYWFADTGEAVPYGRSLTYRFAQVAFWSACLLADVKPFSVPVIKGIIVRHLESWFGDNKIFDNGNVLTVGYKYNQLTMAENYNAPGSPYWGLKVFAFLALDDNHEFWTARAAKLPLLEDLKMIKPAQMLAARYRGSVTIYPAGMQNDFSCGQIPAKYTKFAYSTLFGFSVPKGNVSLSEAACDSTLAFELDGLIMTRLHSKSFVLNEDSLTIYWSPFTGIEVETKIVPKEYGHIRKHKVISDYECKAYDCGFAVSCTDSAKCTHKADSTSACAENVNSKCTVQSDTGSGEIINAVPNTNLVSPKTVIPAIKYLIKKGTNIFTTYIYEV
ncbi:MAG: DUF2264 domain-containing protein [Clostridiales bacterium]|nr:DUF2264 domain-containing protein [Clostridiales bacterium]